MKSKLQRKNDGPGWFEVIFGAALSVILGVILAVVFLVLKPVAVLKELPKEPVPGTVYYIEGTRELSKTRELMSKRRLLNDGTAVAFNEDELNTLAMPSTPAPGSKVMELPQPPVVTEFVTPGQPNFRIREGVMQVGVPVQLSAFELQHKVILQMRGGFRKDGDVLAFNAAQVYVGSLPLDRLPKAKEELLKRIYAQAKVPEELSTAWSKVSNATVEGAKVAVTMR